MALLLGFYRSKADHVPLFIKHTKDYTVLLLLIFVANILLTGLATCPIRYSDCLSSIWICCQPGLDLLIIYFGIETKLNLLLRGFTCGSTSVISDPFIRATMDGAKPISTLVLVLHFLVRLTIFAVSWVHFNIWNIFTKGSRLFYQKKKKKNYQSIFFGRL